MDLNVRPPATWDSLARGPYEVAEYCIAQKTNVLVLLNAWLDSQESPEDDIDWSTINYWASRLRPLWAKLNESDDNSGSESDSGSDGSGRGPGEEIIVVVCNRTGEENGAFVRTFCSCLQTSAP